MSVDLNVPQEGIVSWLLLVYLWLNGYCCKHLILLIGII